MTQTEFVRIVTRNGLIKEIEGPETESIYPGANETRILNRLGQLGYKPYFVTKENTYPYMDKSIAVQLTTIRLSREVNSSN